MLQPPCLSPSLRSASPSTVRSSSRSPPTPSRDDYGPREHCCVQPSCPFLSSLRGSVEATFPCFRLQLSSPRCRVWLCGLLALSDGARPGHDERLTRRWGRRRDYAIGAPWRSTAREAPIGRRAVRTARPEGRGTCRTTHMTRSTPRAGIAGRRALWRIVHRGARRGDASPPTSAAQAGPGAAPGARDASRFRRRMIDARMVPDGDEAHPSSMGSLSEVGLRITNDALDECGVHPARSILRLAMPDRLTSESDPQRAAGGIRPLAWAGASRIVRGRRRGFIRDVPRRFAGGGRVG